MTTELTTTTTTALIPAVYPTDRNPALVYLASLKSDHSKRAMRQSLAVIAGIVLPGCAVEAFPWHLLRYQHTQALRVKLADTTGAPSANRHLYALRGVLKEAWRLGLMSADDYQRAVDLKPVRGEKAQQAEKGRHLTQGEFAALLGACLDGTNAGIRDAAIIAVGYIAGLRRAELAGLLFSDFDQEACTLTIRRGKGNKERIVPVANGACDALLDWLHVRGVEPGPLFTRVWYGDKVTLDGIAEQTVYDMLIRRAEQAGVKKFSPHDLRRTFAGDLLDAGADIATVQKLMGHASVVTTAGYDRRDAKAKRAAVNKLHIPYRRQFK